jgi:ribosomal protein S27E
MPISETALFSKVYCRGCNQVVTYTVKELLATNDHDHQAQNIVCPDCSYIIATFHEQ